MTKQVVISVRDLLDEVIFAVVGMDHHDQPFVVDTPEAAQKWKFPLGTVGYDDCETLRKLFQGKMVNQNVIHFELDEFIEWSDAIFRLLHDIDDEIEGGFSLGIVVEPSTDGWFDYPVGTIYMAGYRDSWPISHASIIDDSEEGTKNV